jgi:MoxR-like ATPase
MTDFDPDISPAPQPRSVRERLQHNAELIGSVFVERDDIIYTSQLALAAREHAVWVGPPGTGKSALARVICMQIKGGIFAEYLMTRQTTESDVIATRSIPDLMVGKERWITDDHLTAAHVAFADEVFKSSGSTLNAMLAWLNERTVKGSITSPLITCFGASNEWQEDDSLNALRDRFLIGHTVDYIEGKGPRLAFLQGIESGWGDVWSRLEPIHVDELAAAHAEIERVRVSDPVLEYLITVQDGCRKGGCPVSDRTIGKAVKMVKAAAWYAGFTDADVDDLDVLRHVLWNAPHEEAIVEAVLKLLPRSIAAEFEVQADELVRDVEELHDRYRNNRNRVHLDLTRMHDDALAILNRIEIFGVTMTERFGDKAKLPVRTLERMRGFARRVRSSSRLLDEIIDAWTVSRFNVDSVLTSDGHKSAYVASASITSGSKDQ